MNYQIIALICVTVLQSVSAATLVFGDGFNKDGSGSFGVDPKNNPFSTTGMSGRDTSITDGEMSTIVNLSNPSNSVDPFGGMDNFDPLVVGQVNFSSDIYRSAINFDISQLQASLGVAPAGMQHQITSIEVFIEVSGATFSNGVNEVGDSVEWH